jgi:hypothetical protein
MNNFTKIIEKALGSLNEADIQSPNNPIMKQAAQAIEKGISSSGSINANPNAKALASQLFSSSDDNTDNPLYSAFNKIKMNPDNPNLEDKEKEAFLTAAEILKPKTAPETTKKAEDKTSTSDTSTSTPSSSTQQKSQQPNATQYNPLKQAGA